jgi:hypothetical protein
MALARCEKCGCPHGTTFSYAYCHKLADTKSRVFCGKGTCTGVAVVCWLTQEEEQQYVRGERSFAVPFRGMVRVV